MSPIPTHFFAAWSVCLSFVTFVFSTDLHVIWQVHLPGPTTHCVRWKKEKILDRTPNQIVQLQRYNLHRFRRLPDYFSFCYRRYYKMLCTPPSITQISWHFKNQIKPTLRHTNVRTERFLYADHALQLQANSIDNIKPTTDRPLALRPLLSTSAAFFSFTQQPKRRLDSADTRHALHGMKSL